MSVVIAHKSGIMASDSACQSDDIMFTVNDKMVKMRNCLVGMVGDNGPCSRIYRHLMSNTTIDIESAYYVNELIRDATTPEDDGDDKESGFSCVIVMRDGTLWIVDGHDSIYQVLAEYIAIGAGNHAALGAYYTCELDKAYTVEGACNIAVKAACHFSASCAPPVRVIRL